MIELSTAFLLGLIGSLHCIGMCGPLALALPVVGKSRGAFVASRLVYNAGRITTYTLIGLLFGLIGKTLALAGFQQWLSIIAGVAMLSVLLLSSRFAVEFPVAKLALRVKAGFARMLQQRSMRSLALLGLLNGLLPCGLVYAAAAGAAAAGTASGGALFMLAFGVGTLPAMLGLGLAGKSLQGAFRFRLQKLIPITVALMGALLILRGLGLGIPYLSPNIAQAEAAAVKCH